MGEVVVGAGRKPSEAEDIVMFNCMFFVFGMHILQYFSVVQVTADLPFRPCMAGLRIMAQNVRGHLHGHPLSKI